MVELQSTRGCWEMIVEKWDRWRMGTSHYPWSRGNAGVRYASRGSGRWHHFLCYLGNLLSSYEWIWLSHSLSSSEWWNYSYEQPHPVYLVLVMEPRAKQGTLPTGLYSKSLREPFWVADFRDPWSMFMLECYKTDTPGQMILLVKWPLSLDIQLYLLAKDHPSRSYGLFISPHSGAEGS